MDDMASVGLKVDSRDVRTASGDLDKFAKSGDRAGGAATKLGKTSKAAFGAMAAAATAAVGALASLGAAISVIREFESSMSQVAAITRASTAELEALRDVAKNLGSTTEFSASQAADGLKFLGMAGFNAAESIAAIPAVLDLATVAALDLGTAADIASNIMSGFGIDAQEAARVADVLAATSTRANTSVTQLGGAMATVAPISAAMGISLEDTASAIGIMSDAGIQGERAGTALRGVLASLAGPTTQAKDVLAAYGLTAADVNPETVGLSKAMEALGTAGVSTADAMQIFGREAASGALVLIDAGNKIDTFSEAIEAASGAAADGAAIFRDNLGGDALAAASALAGLAIALGEAGLTAVLRGALTVVTGFARGLTTLTESVSGFFTAHDPVEQAVLRAADAMNQEARQALQLSNRLLEMGEVSYDVLGAKIALVETTLRSIEANRQESVSLAKTSEAYRDAANTVAQANDVIATYQSLVNAGIELSPENLASYDDWIGKLQSAVAVQEEIVANAGAVGPEYDKAVAELDILKAYLADADGATVTLGKNTEDVTTNLNTAAGAAAGLERNLIAAGSALSALVNSTANLGIEAIGLEAQNRALEAGNSLIDARTQGLIATKREELSSALGPSSPDGLRASATLELDKYIAALNRTSAAQTTNDALTKAYNDSIRETSAATAGVGGASGAINKTADALQGQISALEDAADPLRAYNRGMAELDALKLEGLSDGAYALAVQELTEELENAQGATDNFTQTFMDGMGRAIDYMVGGFKDGFSGLLDIIKSTLLQAVQFAIANPIKLAMGIGGGGASGAVSQAGGLLGGGGGLGGMLGKGIFGKTGMFGSMGSSLGTNIGSMIGGQGSALASSLGGLGASIGAAVPYIALAVAAISFFKTKTKTIDEGIRATIDMEDAMFQSFKEIEKSRFWGLSKKRSTSVNEMSKEQDDPLQAAVFGIRESVIGATESLGVSIDVFDGFTHDFTLSLKGLDEAARQAAITEEFTRMGDSLASLVPHITSMNELFAVAANRVSLTDRLLQAQGKTEELTARIRGREMDATNKLNKALLAQVFAAEDAANRVAIAAADAANRVAIAAADAANRVSLTDRLLQAQGKTEELTARIRAREMDATNELNKALLAQVFAAEDAAIAADALSDSLRAMLNEDLFATGQDFVRATSRANNGQAFTPQQSDAELRAELRALNVSMERLVSTSEITAGNTGRGADAADDTLAFTVEQTL